MARPTARVLALLELLQSGGTRTAGDLAARLDVDERTLRRYVEHLRDLDVPVRTVRGRHGGYRIGPGFRMPPLMLTDEEGLAVLLGLAAARRTGLVATSADAGDSAAAKLRRVLPERLVRRVDALLGSTGFTAPERPAAAPEAGVLLVLAEAARDRRPVAITYTDHAGHVGDRTLAPYGIVAHSGRWYVTGADSASGEVRTFRLDRISAPALRPGTFEVPSGADPQAHVLAGIAGVRRAHAVAVRVAGTVEEISGRLPAGVATVAPAGPGTVRVRLEAERLDWVPALLARLDRPFVVEGPDALRERVRALSERLRASADADPDGPVPG